MPRIVKPLTDKEIKSARIQEKNYTLRDGDGLYLIIRTSGSKTWYMDYYRPSSKKRANICLGVYPLLSLAQARDKRREIKGLLQQGVDPKFYEMEKRTKAATEERNTFKAVSLAWFEQKRKKLDAEYSTQVMSFFNNHIFPRIGDMPISIISPPFVISELKEIAKKNSDDFALRLCRLINQVMQFAVNTGFAEYNALAGIKDAFTAEPMKPMVTIDHSEISTFLAEIMALDASPLSKYLVMWQLHTMVRPEEATTVEWTDIDFEKKLWLMPASKTKKKRDHYVPLTDQSLEILKNVKAYSWNRKFVFSSPYKIDQPVGRGTVNRLIRKTNFKGKVVAHGFRSLASTTLNELADFRPDLIDECLAHLVRGRTEARYNRAKYIDQRRDIMSWWSNFIEDLTK